MDKILAVVFIVIGALALAAGLSLLFAWPLMLLINFVFGEKFLTFVFGVSQITYWKAFWLGFITGSLFGKTVNTNNK